MKKTIKRIVCILLSVLLLVALYIGGSFGLSAVKKYALERKITAETHTGVSGADRIHFLDTRNSDCILIESNGKFALVDAAEDTDNVRGFEALALEGFEDKVVDYLKKVAADDKGKVTLDWVLGTHAHSDHLGGFDTILLDPDITVKKAFLKTYNETYISEFEIAEWDNKEVYEQMVNACRARGVELVQDIPDEPWQFEDYTVQFFNTAVNTTKRVGENENAIGTKLTIHGKAAFLAADINNFEKTESAIAKQVGKVDLLKVGHHGYSDSTTFPLVRVLRPKISIMTSAGTYYGNLPGRAYLILISHSAILTTGAHKGIIADFTSDNIRLTDQIH